MRIGVKEVLFGPAFAEPFENEFNRDARTLDDRFAEHYLGISLNIVLPLHVGLLRMLDSIALSCYWFIHTHSVGRPSTPTPAQSRGAWCFRRPSAARQIARGNPFRRPWSRHRTCRSRRMAGGQPARR